MDAGVIFGPWLTSWPAVLLVLSVVLGVLLARSLDRDGGEP
jgi:hypothetical protein